MQLLLLHLDDALELQPDFVRACTLAGACHHVDKRGGSEIRLWGRQKMLSDLGRDISRSLPPRGRGPQLAFMGSGDFHHVTALLLDTALELRPVSTTLVHFDNHPDWVNFEGGMHCGSWINSALSNPRIDKVVTVGVCSGDLRNPERKGANLRWLREAKLELYPYEHPPSRVSAEYGSGASYRQDGRALYWKSISEVGEENFIDLILSRIGTEAVYFTIDKDVLGADDAVTNWDQGRMRLPYLMALISEIGSRHRVVGADVIGDYSVPSYAGGLKTRLLKQAEIFIDQPRLRQAADAVRNINSAANHALLEVLAESME
ncbi:arginase family protein [Rhizobium leguminosarum]|uniref:arginase family protein n=1 Tax=Rhizobium leguminosarum TaxID=384 RepID=UPI001C91D4A3|nr:arginase family protein [Rhizobium leguminosarum]MBY2994949.1 arginase family protein [Rhizobium leguminosarum]MBY3059720.1 arginase family protein [Rhizobium leguminosarum]